MLRAPLHFVASVFIATVMVIFQTTSSNLIWLSSLNMPVTLQIGLSSYLNDLVAMNQTQGVPVPLFALIAASLLIAFLFTRIGLIWIKMNQVLAYSIAGGAAIVAIVVLMPMAFYNLDLLPGARTAIGKIFLGTCGIASGLYFGFALTHKERKSQL